MWYGIEVVNRGDFTVRVQDVQLVYGPVGDPDAPPVIVGLRRDEASIPGTVEPHDSGFIASGLPPGSDGLSPVRLSVYANAITAVGNVRSAACDAQDPPPLSAPMRFVRMFPDVDDEGPTIY